MALRNAARTIARNARLASTAGSSHVPSPCVSVCRIDERSGFCEGCLRTIDEIIAWGPLPDAAKREVWTRLAQRADAILAAPADAAPPPERHPR